MIYPTFYVTWIFTLLRKERSAGIAVGPLIFIRPKYKDDKGLLEHEKEHVRQFWKYLGINGLLYFFSQKWRYKFELDAYKVQLKYSTNKDASAKLFAGYIINNYKLDNLNKDAVIRELLQG